MKNLTIIASRSITINRFLLEVSNSLSEKFIVVLCCKDPNNINNINNLQKECIEFPDSFKELLDFKKTFKMIKQIINILNNSDLIYLHTPLASHLVRFVNIFIIKKVKIIYHVHGLRYIPGNWSFREFIYRLVEFFLSFKTNKFIAINKLDYMSLLKFIPTKIHLIKGVGVKLPSEFKIRELPSKDNVFIVGVIAAYKKSKGYEELLKIAKLCQNNKIIFKTFGYGDNQWLKDLIKKNSIENIEVKGYIQNIENEIDKFNLFLLPSHREGLNVSIQECLSKGIPILTTNVRGCKDLIYEGYNGFIYDKDDVLKASSIIKKITVMNNDKYVNLSRNCIEYSKKYLSRQLKINEILEIFKEYAV